MITITGGKLTTWRRMAKQTVDRIVERDGNDARCITHELPLGMAVAPEDLTAAPEWAREQLAGRYGHIAHDVLAIAAAPRSSGSSPSRPDLLAEVVYAARREQARTVGDVLLRRTRLGLTAARSLTPRRDRAAWRRRSARSSAGTKPAARARSTPSRTRPAQKASSRTVTFRARSAG